MADTDQKVEGNIGVEQMGYARRWHHRGQRAWHVSKVYQVNVGYPCCPLRMEYCPTSVKAREAKWQQGSQRGNSTNEASNDRGGKDRR